MIAKAASDELLLKGGPEDAPASPQDEAKAREVLAGMKPGDVIHLRTRSKVDLWRFDRLLPPGQKSAFVATNIRGKSYKVPLESVVVPQPKVEKWMRMAFGPVAADAPREAEEDERDMERRAALAELED